MKLAAPLLAITLALSSTAYAGGPVVVVEETEVVAEKSGSSVGILPIIGIGVLLCLAICSKDDEETVIIAQPS